MVEHAAPAAVGLDEPALLRRERCLKVVPGLTPSWRANTVVVRGMAKLLRKEARPRPSVTFSAERAMREVARRTWPALPSPTGRTSARSDPYSYPTLTPLFATSVPWAPCSCRSPVGHECLECFGLFYGLLLPGVMPWFGHDREAAPKARAVYLSRWRWAAVTHLCSGHHVTAQSGVLQSSGTNSSNTPRKLALVLSIAM